MVLDFLWLYLGPIKQRRRLVSEVVAGFLCSVASNVRAVRCLDAPAWADKVSTACFLNRLSAGG